MLWAQTSTWAIRYVPGHPSSAVRPTAHSHQISAVHMACGGHQAEDTCQVGTLTQGAPQPSVCAILGQSCLLLAASNSRQTSGLCLQTWQKSYGHKPSPVGTTQTSRVEPEPPSPVPLPTQQILGTPWFFLKGWAATTLLLAQPTSCPGTPHAWLNQMGPARS